MRRYWLKYLLLIGMKNKVVGYIGITPSQNFLSKSGSEICSALYIREDK